MNVSRDTASDEMMDAWRLIQEAHERARQLLKELYFNYDEDDEERTATFSFNHEGIDFEVWHSDPDWYIDCGDPACALYVARHNYARQHNLDALAEQTQYNEDETEIH